MPVPQTIALEGNNPVITLADGASGALIPLPAEAIARTFQQGDDLIIVLADGNRIAIADFFALEDPSLILRDPASGDYTEVSLGEDGSMIGQQPRSLSELAEMFDASAAEIAELQGAQAAEASASGTAWTMNTGVAAASVGVLAAIGAAVSGSDSDTTTDTGTTDTTDTTDTSTEPVNQMITGTDNDDDLSGGDGNDIWAMTFLCRIWAAGGARPCRSTRIRHSSTSRLTGLARFCLPRPGGLTRQPSVTSTPAKVCRICGSSTPMPARSKPSNCGTGSGC